MRKKAVRVLIYLSQPRTVIFFVALFNFLWFFSQSRSVKEFGSDAISFCLICPWYYDWSFTNPPSLLLFAAALMLFDGWKAHLAACLIGGHQIIEAIAWFSDENGLISGFNARSAIIFNFMDSKIWQLRDLQYFFAFLVFTAALIYLSIGFRQSGDKLPA